MSTARKNKKIIFVIYCLVAIGTYFAHPILLKSLPVKQRSLVSNVDVAGIPNEKKVVSESQIISFSQTGSTNPSRYLVCSIDDDPDGTNAYGVYDPTDLAVTVRNLVRLNVKHLFLGTHLHWPDLPEVENNTLGSQLALLDSCIISTPLRRNAEAQELPKYILSSSLPIENVQEVAHLLPIVNSLSLAPTLDIPENCTVGFSQLESEPKSSYIPLLAVWNNRVILSSLLLERMHRLDVAITDVEISAGYIKLGNSGSVIPINEFGYFVPSSEGIETQADIISAEITSIEESPVDTSIAVLTASGVKANSYRAIEKPLENLNQLALIPIMEDRVDYQRVPWWSELIIAMIIGLLLFLLAGSSKLFFLIGAIILSAGLYFGSFEFHSRTNYFMPVLFILCAILISILTSLFLKKGSVNQSKKKEEEQKQEDNKKEVPEIANPQKLTTLAEKMRAEGSPEEDVPEELKMLIEELEAEGIPIKEVKTKEAEVKDSKVKEGDQKVSIAQASEKNAPTKVAAVKADDLQSLEDFEENFDDDFGGDFCDLDEPSEKTEESKKDKK